MARVDMQELRRDIEKMKKMVFHYYKHQPIFLDSLKWPTLKKVPDVISDEQDWVWVAVYPESEESYMTLVRKQTCENEAAKICASLNPNKPELYGLNWDFAYQMDDNHYIFFICNEKGRLGGFLKNWEVSMMLDFKLDFDNRVTGRRPIRDTVYGPVVVCVLHREEIKNEDGEIEDCVSTAVDITKFDLGKVLADWCNAWFSYHAKRLYPA